MTLFLICILICALISSYYQRKNYESIIIKDSITFGVVYGLISFCVLVLLAKQSKPYETKYSFPLEPTQNGTYLLNSTDFGGNVKYFFLYKDNGGYVPTVVNRSSVLIKESEGIPKVTIIDYNVLGKWFNVLGVTMLSYKKYIIEVPKDTIIEKENLLLRFGSYK